MLCCRRWPKGVLPSYAVCLPAVEGDRKAYYENAEYTMKQNREKIARLRQENNDLYKEKAQKLKVQPNLTEYAFLISTSSIFDTCYREINN